MFKVAYCEYLLEDKEKCTHICQDFVHEVGECFPDLKKVKIHLFLHLVDDMIEFGPTSAFNTER